MRRTGGTYVYDIWVKRKESVNSVEARQEEEVPPPPGINYVRRQWREPRAAVEAAAAEARKSVTTTGSSRIVGSEWATISRHNCKCAPGNCSEQPFTRLGVEVI